MLLGLSGFSFCFDCHLLWFCTVVLYCGSVLSVDFRQSAKRDP